MGGGVSAPCSSGYNAMVQSGCGMMGPEPFEFPAICTACHEIVPADKAANYADSATPSTPTMFALLASICSALRG